MARAKKKTVKAKAKKSVVKISAKKAPAKKVKAGAGKKFGKPVVAKAKPPGTKTAARAAVPRATVRSLAPVKEKRMPTRASLERALVPLEDRIVILVEGPSETTVGGLIIPGTATARPNRGKVLAIGSGKRNKKGQLRPLDVGVGDVVLFPEFAGTQVTLDGTDLLILREEEVLGITK